MWDDHLCMKSWRQATDWMITGIQFIWCILYITCSSCYMTSLPDECLGGQLQPFTKFKLCTTCLQPSEWDTHPQLKTLKTLVSMWKEANECSLTAVTKGQRNLETGDNFRVQLCVKGVWPVTHKGGLFWRQPLTSEALLGQKMMLFRLHFLHKPSNKALDSQQWIGGTMLWNQFNKTFSESHVVISSMHTHIQ